MKTTTIKFVTIIATIAIIFNYNYSFAQANGGGNNDKIEICHYPPGNPDNPQRISIDISALDAHLAHGDNIGGCNHIEKIEFFKFGAYPNPFAEELNVEIELAEESFVCVEVFNQYGSNIHTLLKENVKKGKSSLRLNLKELGYASGMYLLKASTLRETETLMESIVVVMAEY